MFEHGVFRHMWNSWVCVAAIINKHYDCLQLAIAYKCPLSTKMFSAAVDAEFIEGLALLCNVFPFDNAILNDGSVHLVQKCIASTSSTGGDMVYWKKIMYLCSYPTLGGHPNSLIHAWDFWK
jgi:hypothetical protein